MEKARKRAIGFFVLVLVIWGVLPLVYPPSNPNTSNIVDREELIAICSMIRANITSAQIARNIVKIRTSNEELDESYIKDKEDFIYNALETAKEGIVLYNEVSAKYSASNLYDHGLPSKMPLDIDADTEINCN